MFSKNSIEKNDVIGDKSEMKNIKESEIDNLCNRALRDISEYETVDNEKKSEEEIKRIEEIRIKLKSYI